MRWRESRNGNRFCVTPDGFVVILFERGNYENWDKAPSPYGYCIKCDGDDEVLEIEGDFDSEDEAQEAALQALKELRDKTVL